MPMWRCPHCGTPQAETARCWVCRRSSTACGTCRHFRRSVAAQIGYCGLDRRRQPLQGHEIRPCWDAGPAGAHVGGSSPSTIRPAAVQADIGRHRDFIEVTPRGSHDATARTDGAPTSAPSTAAPSSSPPSLPGIEPPQSGPGGAPQPGWSLWSEFEG